MPPIPNATANATASALKIIINAEFTSDLAIPNWDNVKNAPIVTITILTINATASLYLNLLLIEFSKKFPTKIAIPKIIAELKAYGI